MQIKVISVPVMGGDEQVFVPLLNNQDKDGGFTVLSSRFSSPWMVKDRLLTFYVQGFD